MKLMELLESLNIVAFAGESAQRLQNYEVKLRELGYDSSISEIRIDFKDQTIYLVAAE